jgi:hypothetical protein
MKKAANSQIVTTCLRSAGTPRVEAGIDVADARRVTTLELSSTKSAYCLRFDTSLQLAPMSVPKFFDRCQLRTYRPDDCDSSIGNSLFRF